MISLSIFRLSILNQTLSYRLARSFLANRRYVVPRTYLKDHYLEDHKLGQRALLEFGRALRSGRMIAFTGAMTTEAFGYGSWAQLREEAKRIAENIVEKVAAGAGTGAGNRAKALISEIEAFSRQNDSKMPAQIATSLIEEVLEAIRIDSKKLREYVGTKFETAKDYKSWPLDDLFNRTTAFDLFDIETAWHFRRPTGEAYSDTEAGLERFNVPRALARDLGIRRFATLNYDFELERETMLPCEEMFALDENEGKLKPTSPFSQLERLRRRGESDYFSWNLGSGRIRRVLPDGTAVESDIRNRERVDRMLEFAIGGDDIDRHIIHLHGRACTPSSMIVSRRDYNRLYRSNDLHRLPFEHAGRMLFGGNPVLFIGLGMTEAEVNYELEQFISANPYRRTAPTFLLWNTGGGAMDVTAQRMQRLEWLNRLGVLAIFDSDLEGLTAGLDPHFLASEHRFCFEQRPHVGAVRVVERQRSLAMKRASSRSAIAKRRLAGIKSPAKPTGDDKRIRAEMVSAIRSLPRAAAIFADREEYIPSTQSADGRPHEAAWRSISSLVPAGEGVCLWQSIFPEPFNALFEVGRRHVLYDEPSINVRKPRLVRAKRLLTESDRFPFQVDIQPTGSGRGWNSRLMLADEWTGIPCSDRLLMNGGFSFDTDSLLHGIERFLRTRTFPVGVTPSNSSPMSRSEYFQSGVLNGDDDHQVAEDSASDVAVGKGRARPLLIILNGMERFFSTDGVPLSAELDELMQLAVRTTGFNRVRWIISGSARVYKYFTTLNNEARGASSIGPVTFCERMVLDHGPERPGAVPALQLAMVQQAVGFELRRRLNADLQWRAEDENIAALRAASPSLARELDRAITAYFAQIRGAISGDIKGVRKVFYQLILTPSVQTALFGEEAPLAMECLRAMAFLGTPSEIAVLIHVPRIYELMSNEQDDLGTRHSRLQILLGRMCDLALVIEIEGFPYTFGRDRCDQPKRYAIHRSLMTELRASFGIPLSEAKLSTAFNMSLYVAQPIDGFVPEPEVHDELGTLIDRLIGSYMDAGNGQRAVIYGETFRWNDYLAGCDHGPSFKDGMVAVETAVTAAFDKLDPIRSRQDRQDKNKRKGTGFRRREFFHRMCLPEHVQCLRAALAVVRGYYSTTGLLTLDTNDRLASPERNGVLLEHAERLDTLIDGFGKQAMARQALREALPENLFKAAFGCAEPFYPDELVWLHNERGVVMLAMGDLYEARRSLILAMRINRDHVEYQHRGHNWRRIRLNQLAVDIEAAELDLASRKIEEIKRASQGIKCGVDYVKLREDRLAKAICQGYEGFIQHMRGHRIRATKQYSKAIATFEELRELRAEVYFARLRARAQTFGRSRMERLVALDRVHDLALSGRQMDLVYRIQVLKAETIVMSPEVTPSERRRAIRMLDDALRYALHTDVGRVRCEALGSMAQARHLSGDHEGALSNASDALTIAVRYGLEMRKMTLRSMFARILAARGHPLTAEQLARTAIKVASRQKIQYAIDHAEETLAAIPRHSVLSGAENLSGRRDF